jgi:hypothetical protein
MIMNVRWDKREALCEAPLPRLVQSRADKQVVLDRRECDARLRHFQGQTAYLQSSFGLLPSLEIWRDSHAEMDRGGTLQVTLAPGPYTIVDVTRAYSYSNIPKSYSMPRHG